MPSRNVLPPQPPDLAPVAGRRAAAGCWKLASGRALSLRPRQRSVLEIARGRAWVTVGDGARWWPWPARGAGVDLVLQTGERLTIGPGRHVVVEAWWPVGADPAAATDLAFRWDVAPAGCALVEAGAQHSAAATAPAAAAAIEWDGAVVQPLRDLVHALSQGGRAVGTAVADALAAGARLAWGVARFARYRIATPLRSRAI